MAALVGFTLQRVPKLAVLFEIASATAFLVVGVILLLEMVQVFLPPARVMSLSKTLAPPEPTVAETED